MCYKINIIAYVQIYTPPTHAHVMLSNIFYNKIIILIIYVVEKCISDFHTIESNVLQVDKMY